MGITKEEIAAWLESGLRLERTYLAIAEKLRASHPSVSHCVREPASLRADIIEELLRRLQHEDPAILEQFGDRIQFEREHEDHVRHLTEAELLRGVLQELWRNRKLLKAARADGLDLYQLADLMCLSLN
jgi:hypothetical protein